MGRVFGIDLGTSSCSISVMENGKPRVLPVFDGRDEMPTYVSFLPDGGRLMGWEAKKQAITHPENTVFTIKRLIGRPFDAAATQRELGLLPYKVAPAASGGLWVEACGRSYSPIEITSLMLGEVKRAAEAYLHEPVVDAVITVPAFFGRVQRKATEAAAKLAGLDDVRMIPEPVAAALAYGSGAEVGGRIAVYDLGGGTFDISILEIGDGVAEVRAVNGDNLLGGEDFDHALVRALAADIRAKHGIDVASDPLALHRVKDAAEKLKIDLDRAKIAHVELPYLRMTPHPVHVSIDLDRARLDAIVAPLIDRTIGPCMSALRDAGLAKEEIESVILVGGMSRMPAVRERVRAFFGQAPKCHDDPSRVVSLGAAIQGGVMEGSVKDTVLLDVIPRSLGVSTSSGVYWRLLQRNTTIPTKKSYVFKIGSATKADHVALDLRDGCIDIYEGEFELAGENDCMASIDVRAIGAETGALLEVTFELGELTQPSPGRRMRPDRFGVEIKNTATGQKVFQWVEPLVLRSVSEERAFEQSRKAPRLENADQAKAYAEDLIVAVDEIAHAATGAVKVKLDQARGNALRALQSRDINELGYATEALSQASGIVIKPGASASTQATDLKANRPDNCVFISYAHEDAGWLAKLRVHLRPLERLGAVEIWHDKKIAAGDEWRTEIDGALSRANVAVLLVSAHFLASDFIYDHELPPLLDRYASKGVAILPIFVGPCYFERDPFLKRLQAFNNPSRPLKALSEAEVETELAKVTKAIWARVEA
jgi:molecular chaperone DnaK